MYVEKKKMKKRKKTPQTQLVIIFNKGGVICILNGAMNTFLVLTQNTHLLNLENELLHKTPLKIPKQSSVKLPFTFLNHENNFRTQEFNQAERICLKILKITGTDKLLIVLKWEKTKLFFILKLPCLKGCSRNGHWKKIWLV